MADWQEATPANTWKPEKKGDEIVGLLIDIQHEVGENKSTLYTVESEGENKNIWGSTVLDSRLRNVKIGEEVRIVYLGLGEKKGGKNAPKLFQVFHRQPEIDGVPFN